jgi:hypothetical protein
MERSAYLPQSTAIRETIVSALLPTQRLYERGVKSGVFRAGLDLVDIHASISAMTFFNVSNQHTFEPIFKDSGERAAAADLRRSSITDMVLCFVRSKQWRT